MNLIEVNVDLKSASTVAIKFGEIISDAIGGYCRPWQIKRVGSAEAEVESLKALARAKTEIEITDLQRRALQRFVEEEAQKQANIEEIAGKALSQISDKARPEEMSRDWIVHFFDRCRLTSDEDMQLLWAKVLTGEADRPGSFSKRTLDVLETLEKFDAKNFELLCRFAWNMKGLPIPIIYDFDSKHLKEVGLTFGRLQHLSEVGLISLRDGFQFTQRWDPPQEVVSYFGRHVEVALPKDEGAAMNVGHVMLTKVGIDLWSICRVEPILGYMEEIVSIWKSTLHYRVKDAPLSPITNESTAARDDVSTTPPKAAPPVWG